jgi:hypothetical protein
MVDINETPTIETSKGLKEWLIKKEIMGLAMIGLVIFLCAGTIKGLHGWYFWVG